MNNNGQPLQTKLIPPDLNGYQQNRKFDIKSELNCIGIGTIQSFDPTDQTVEVSLNYLRVVKGGIASAAPQNDFTDDRSFSYPVLVKCPLLILSGGGATITFPVAPGDSCVILFCDRDIDNWWSTGNVAVPNSNRVHDLNDAIVLVGLRNLVSAIVEYFVGFKIAYGDAFITIDPVGNIIISGTTVAINP